MAVPTPHSRQDRFEQSAIKQTNMILSVTSRVLNRIPLCKHSFIPLPIKLINEKNERQIEAQFKQLIEQVLRDNLR